jgi:Domain of unknown function (DUF927)
MTVRTLAITGDEPMHNTHPVRAITKNKIRRIFAVSETAKLDDLILLSHVLDDATDNAAFEIAFKTGGGQYRTIAISKELRFHPGKIRDLLARADAKLPADPTEATKHVKSVLESSPGRWCRTAAQFGWHAGGTAFVSHARVIGRNPSGRKQSFRRILPSTASRRDGVGHLGQAGTLAGWLDQVASHAKNSTTITLSLSVAFASPLLSLIDWHPFLVVLHGSSKVGKSTAALAAASVIGIGVEAKLPNWNATHAKLNEMGDSFNDMPMVLNGLESRREGNKELREFLRSVTYMLGDGTDTARHSSYTEQNGDNSRIRRSIVLVTSELSFDEIAALAGGARQGGEKARAIDVPAACYECDTIINRFPKLRQGDRVEQTAFSRLMLQELRAGCAENHGVALAPFVKYLLTFEREKLRREILALQATFVKTVDTGRASEPIVHAAKNFGVIYAGGILAVRAGLLPLSERVLLKRLKACFQRCMAPKPDKTRAHGLQLLNAGLNAAIDGVKRGEHRETFQSEPKNGASSSRIPLRFTIAATTLFRSWFAGDVAAMNAALLWLRANQLLVLKPSPHEMSGRLSIETARRNKRINGRQVGCIVFDDPRPALKAILETSKSPCTLKWGEKR